MGERDSKVKKEMGKDNGAKRRENKNKGSTPTEGSRHLSI